MHGGFSGVIWNLKMFINEFEFVSMTHLLLCSIGAVCTFIVGIPWLPR